MKRLTLMKLIPYLRPSLPLSSSTCDESLSTRSAEENKSALSLILRRQRRMWRKRRWGEGRGVRAGVMPEAVGHHRKGSGGPGRQAAVITHDNPTAWHRWPTQVLLGASDQQGQVPIRWARLQHWWTALAIGGRSAGWLCLTLARLG